MPDKILLATSVGFRQECRLWGTRGNDQTESTEKTMKKLIYTLACMLLVSAISIPIAEARDQSRDSLQHKIKRLERQQQRWETVQHSTGAARQEALQQYLYNLPSQWDDESPP